MSRHFHLDKTCKKPKQWGKYRIGVDGYVYDMEGSLICCVGEHKYFFIKEEIQKQLIN